MENMSALEVANSPAIWAMASIGVLAVISETFMFFFLARKAAASGRINLTSKQCHRALRSGILTAIGPSFGVFIVMIGLIAVVGGPIAWLKLSTIGGASTELTAATVGVKALGGDISQTVTVLQMSNAWWTMIINACGWLVVTWLFAWRMEKVRGKIGGGDSRWLAVFSSAATLGIFGAFCSDYAIIAIKSVDYSVVVCMVCAAAGMWALMKISNRLIWLKEYCLGLAMLIGIVAGFIAM